MKKNDFKVVEYPTLLGATFRVKTTADSKPIICKVNEHGNWSFIVQKDMPANLLSEVEDICISQFAPQVWEHIFGNPDAIKFFDDALKKEV
jgi:hypothetical protein